LPCSRTPANRSSYALQDSVAASIIATMKALVELLTEKLILQAKFISPWGYVIEYILEK